MVISPSVSLLEDLHALAADGRNVHNLLCMTKDLDDEDNCSCGAAKVLRALAELLPLPADAAQPYRPAWTPGSAVTQ